MTARRATELANRKLVPNHQIIEHYASQYGLDPTKLASVLSEFGQLPDCGQEQLIRCLVLVIGQYQVLAKRIGRMTSSQLRIRLAAVEATAKKLLHQFGIKPDHPSVEPGPDWRIITMQLAIAGTDTKDKDSVVVNAELAKASDQVASAVIGILDLYRRAKTARQATTKHIAPGHGGHRHRPNPKGQLIRDAIAVYEHMRNQHPGSGNKPGYGGGLLRFIHAVADLCGTAVRDADVRDAWRRWKSKRK